jgi:hypothetical protein
LPATVLARQRSAPYEHDGFYLGAELGAGFGYVDSSASINNGFRQSIDSSAFGRVIPALVIDAGGTTRNAQLVLGGRVAFLPIVEPELRAKGYEFRVEDGRLEFVNVHVFTHYYPDLRGGAFFGGAIGFASLKSTAGDDEQQRGFSASLEGGYRAWLGPQWSLGGVVRVTGARVEGDDFGVTTVFAPTLSASIAWH